MTAQPYKTWRMFDSTDGAIDYRREHGTGGWIFSYADSAEAVLFPWQMTPSEIFQSVFVVNRHGYLIGYDDKRRPQDEMRDLPKAAPVLERLVKPARRYLLAPSEQIGPRMNGTV